MATALAVGPPACVLGLKPDHGEIDGGHDEAIRAAPLAIERQTSAAHLSLG
jgi:hypothetical protein